MRLLSLKMRQRSIIKRNLNGNKRSTTSSSSSSSLPTPTNAKPQQHLHRTSDLASAATSSSTTPVPSPEPVLPSPTVRRRSMSPPLPPAMSPDNGRPLPHLPTILTQPATDQRQIHIQLSIVDSIENPIKAIDRSNITGQVCLSSFNRARANRVFCFSRLRCQSNLNESKCLIDIY
jgi:hypothetical protein